MAQAVVTIAGRTYRMNCDEGEEAHIEQLARAVDAKIGELRGAFGEIGDQRITVMAALTIADELFIARNRLEAASLAAEEARAETQSARQDAEAWALKAAAALERAAEGVEAAARALGRDPD